MGDNDILKINIPQGDVNGGVDNWLRHLNVPHVILGPAGHALSEFIGLGVGVINVKLRGWVSSQETENKARDLVQMAVARAAGDMAAHDPEIINKAMDRWLVHGLKRQTNREGVAAKTIEFLSDADRDPIPLPAGATAENISDDWLNVFGKYAENASSEELQSFWGKVLAGKIRNNKSISIRTLRILSEIDHHTAQLVDKYAAYIVNETAILSPDTPIAKRDMLHLHDAGLLSGSYGGSLIDTGPNDQLLIGTKYGLFLIYPIEQMLTALSPSTMSAAGRDIFKLATPHLDMDIIEDWGKNLPKAGLSRIVWCAMSDAPDYIPKGSHFIWAQDGSSA